MKTTNKKIPVVNVRETKEQRRASKRAVLALTLCLTSTASFNAGYCMEVEENNGNKKTQHTVKINNSAMDVEVPDGQNLSDGNQNVSIFEDPKFLTLWNGIKTADKMLQGQLDQQRRNEPVTILLGRSGAGKTTLHKYLRGIPLEAKSTDDYNLPFDIQPVNGAAEEEGLVIGRTCGAQTTYPVLKGGYFDCPGFEETRGQIQEIINGYSIKKIFEEVGRFNLLLAVSSGQFADKGAEFLKLLRNLGEMFNEDESILQALNIVVTKSDKMDDGIQKLKKKIKNISLDNIGISPFQKKALELLSKEENKQIAFFYRPIKEGPISSDMQLVTDSTYLFGGGVKVGKGLKNITPKIVIPESADNYLAAIRKKMKIEISNTISSFYNKLQDEARVRDFIAAQNMTAQELRSNFREIFYQLNVEKPKYKNIQNLLQLFDKEESENFSSLMAIRKFLKHTNPKHNVELNREKVSNLKEYFEPFSKEIVCDYIDKQLTINGNIVGTSDVLQYIDAYPPLQQLNICGFNHLVVDSDLILPNTNLVLTTKFLNVLPNQEDGQPRLISLRGKDGSPENKGRAYNGGTANITFVTISGGDSLRVDMSGGNGGIPTPWDMENYHNNIYFGYNESLKENPYSAFPTYWHIEDSGYAVHGKDGPDGEPGRIEDVLSRDQNYLVCSNGNFIETEEFYRSGTYGEKGKDVYEKHEGTQGGMPGYIDINGYEYGSADSYQGINLTMNKGSDGPSAGGTPGLGGLSGNLIWEGIYINSSIPGRSGWKEGSPYSVRPLRAPSGRILEGTVSGPKAIEIESIDTSRDLFLNILNPNINQRRNEMRKEKILISLLDEDSNSELENTSRVSSSVSLEETDSDSSKRSRDESDEGGDEDSNPRPLKQFKNKKES